MAYIDAVISSRFAIRIPMASGGRSKLENATGQELQHRIPKPASEREFTYTNDGMDLGASPCLVDGVS